MEITFCQTGLAKHAPHVGPALRTEGVEVRMIECFDKCETCERVLLARIDGTLARFSDGEALLEAVVEIRAGG